jgi:hypothetical protein
LWDVYYTRTRNKELKINAHSASNTPPMDERINFGQKDSAINYIPKIFPDSFYQSENRAMEFGQEE